MGEQFIHMPRRNLTLRVLTHILAGMVGVLGGMLWVNHETKSSSTSRTFEHENQRKIIREYRKLASDKIFVEIEQGSGRYVTVGKYLSGIEDKYDRKIERTKIEKLVDWNNWAKKE